MNRLAPALAEGLANGSDRHRRQWPALKGRITLPGEDIADRNDDCSDERGVQR